jgi:hypothetical protein
MSIKIYFRLNTLRLCKNLMRTVDSRQFAAFDAFPAAQRVTYRFYVGRLAVFDENYVSLSWFGQMRSGVVGKQGPAWLPSAAAAAALAVSAAGHAGTLTPGPCSACLPACPSMVPGPAARGAGELGVRTAALPQGGAAQQGPSPQVPCAGGLAGWRAGGAGLVL